MAINKFLEPNDTDDATHKNVQILPKWYLKGQSQNEMLIF